MKVAKLLQGPNAWNAWRIENPGTRPDLQGAILIGADLQDAKLGGTVFASVNLREAHGLDSCYYSSPSIIDSPALQRSPLPVAFLRGGGLSDWEIEAAKLHQDGLTLSQITDSAYKLVDIRGKSPIQFYSCFIIYSSKDEEFAQRLHADLQDSGVRCWVAPHNMKIGDEFRSRIDQAIHLHDCLLRILSEHSVSSRWVQKEVETAFEKEDRDNRLVLFPVHVDSAIMDSTVGWAADIRRQRYIGDFTH